MKDTIIWNLSFDPPQEEKNEIEPIKCDCCLDVTDEVFTLGITTYGLKEKNLVCSYCLNELHNNLTLTN